MSVSGPISFEKKKLDVGGPTFLQSSAQQVLALGIGMVPCCFISLCAVIDERRNDFAGSG